LSGLVAVIRPAGRQAESGAELDRLAAAYELLHETGTRHAASSPLGGVVKFETPTESGRGIQSAGPSWTAAVGTVHGPLSAGTPALAHLDGRFGLVAYDDSAGTLTVATDPFAFQAVYVAERDGTTFVSTSALVLARHLRAGQDELGRLMFLRAGYQVGPLTHWQGIERLEPGVSITVGRDGSTTRSVYWLPAVDPAVTRLGFRDAVDHCIEAVEATQRDYLAAGPPVWSDLTGGYDTRFMNLVLDRAGVSFFTNTVGDAAEPDVQIGRAVAEAAGWDWTQLELPDRWPELLPDVLPLSLCWSDGRLEALQLAQVLWGHARKADRSPNLLLGGGHEHFRGHVWQQEFLQAGKSNRVNFDNLLQMRWLSQPLAAPIFARDPTAEVRADLRARAEAWVEPYRSELNTVQLDILHARRMVAHFGAFADAGGCFQDVRVPAYYKPVFQTAVSVDHRHRSSHRLMRHMIARMSPGVAAIETTAGGPAEPLAVRNAHRFAPYYASIGRKAVTKLSGKLIGRSLLVRVPPLDRRVTEARRALLEGLGLQPDAMRSLSLYDPRALGAFLDSARSPDFAAGTMLARVVTLELVLRAAEDGELLTTPDESRRRVRALIDAAAQA
jgi:hypothetical protein